MNEHAPPPSFARPDRDGWASSRHDHDSFMANFGHDSVLVDSSLRSEVVSKCILVALNSSLQPTSKSSSISVLPSVLPRAEDENWSYTGSYWFVFPHASQLAI